MKSSPSYPQVDWRESPGYLRISLAAAMTLGFKQGRFFRRAISPCLNLLLTYADGCRGNCAYCGLGRARPGEFGSKSFIRVTWPIYSIDEILRSTLEREKDLRRICLSMVTNQRAPGDTRLILGRLHNATALPISVLMTPTILHKYDLVDFRELGADRIGIAIDAATAALFEETRGRKVGGPHRWERYWECFEECIDIFGHGRVGIHLIVGLGETEKEMAEIMGRIRKIGGTIHLFSFYPEEGSLFSSRPQAPSPQFRRIQLARYLLEKDLVKPSGFRYDERSRIIDFGLSQDVVDTAIDSGLPFMTSGCPDADGGSACNRPYGDSPPGDDIRSFPFLPEASDIEKIRSEIWDYS